MNIRHRCPICGHLHYRPAASQFCVCGHLRILHDDQGGRRKKAPCTTWINLDTNPTQCTCEDFTE